MEATKSLVSKIVERDEKVIIFSQYVDVVKQISAELSEMSENKCLTMTGGTKQKSSSN